MTSARSGKNEPLVSVCIPSYNASRFIGETIRSVLDSTYANLEVVVSDDASTDDTREIAEAISDARVRFFPNDRNVGAPGNWNRALERARGKYVGLLNHDDLYGPFWLTFAVHALDNHRHIGWVTSAYRVIDAEGRTLKFIDRFSKSGEIDRAEAFLAAATRWQFGPAFLARREALEAIDGYDEAFGAYADADLHIRLAARYPLCYSAWPHVAWRLHLTNLSHRFGEIEQSVVASRMLRKTFSDPTLPEELRCLKQICYNHYRDSVMAGRMRLLESGDLETAQRLTDVLRASGYEG